MRIKHKYGTKERLFELMGESYELNAVDNQEYYLNKYFNDLITNNVNITNQDIKKIPNKEDSYLITIECTDNEIKLMFTFFCKIDEFNLDNVDLIKDCFLYSLTVFGSNNSTFNKEYLVDFNKKNKEKIVDYITNLVELCKDDDISENNIINELGKKIDEMENLTANDYVKHLYSRLSVKEKEFYIERAEDLVDIRLVGRGVNPFDMKNDKEYRNSIKNVAIALYKRNIEDLNETNSYPKEIGHKFKVKKQYKLDKKRRKSVTTLHEDDDSELNKLN